MILYANGCSMTFGSELVPHQYDREPRVAAYREYHAWPGQLGELIGAERVVNDSKGAGSNERVARTTLDYFAGLSDEEAADYYVVIGWSHACRNEFPSVNNVGEIEYVLYYLNQKYEYVRNNFPKEVEKFVALYDRYSAHDVHDNMRSVHLYAGLQNYLVARGVRYLFFDALNLSADIRQETSLIDQRRYLDFTSPHGNMYRWIVENGYPQKPKGHPGKEGHRAWAEHLYRYMQKLGDV